MSEARTATLERQTSESKVRVSLDLDGTGHSQISTGVGFFDHMLTAFARHSLIDLDVESSGDWHIDAHHTVEDTAIVLGLALRSALGDKRGFDDSAMPSCRWMRRSLRRWSMCPGDRTAYTRVSRQVRNMY